jgi:putative colanic acid biosynthesis UDP-glucose lipid carrier transferase
MGTRPGVLRRYSGALSTTLRVTDILLVLVAGVLAYAIRFDGFESPPQPYLVLMFVGALLAAVAFPAFQVYRPWRAQRRWEPAVRALGAWLFVFVTLLVLLVAMHEAETFSRRWLVTWFVLSGLLCALARFVLYSALRRLRRLGYNQRSVVIIGGGTQALELCRRVETEDWAGFRVAAIFDETGGGDLLGVTPILPMSGAEDYLAANAIDEVWIALPLEQSERLRDVVTRLRYTAANIRYVPDLFGVFLLNHGVTDVLDVPMIDLTASPMQGAGRILKGIEDRVLAVLILLLISPLMLLIAVGVKLSSPGPVFYRQERMSWNGRTFGMLKFRSMRVDAEAASGAVWARKGDNRVTGLGTFLRRTSLDELPQFINVLKGEMSIVGPRPERPVFVEQFKGEIPGYMQKHLMKAGITGWAQVNGWRGRTDLKMRIEHDIYYIGHWSLWFDLKIIFLTILKGFIDTNAY